MFASDLADNSAGYDVGGVDFSTLFSGGGGGVSGFDFSSLVSGSGQVAQAASNGASGNDLAGMIGGGAGAALGSALLPGIGTALGGTIGKALGGLFGGTKTNDATQSADVNTIANNNGILASEAGAAVAWHADHSSDNFNDLAAFCATNNVRFLQLVDEYNSANPTRRIVPGSATQAAAQAATAQQQLLTTAVSTPDFGSTATGQQLVSTLQAMPTSQAVGTQGMTAGDYLSQILKGILTGAQKGGSDAAADTPLGQQMKSSYIKDWLKDNQLLAAAIGVGLAFTAYKAYGPKGGKISL